MISFVWTENLMGYTVHNVIMYKALSIIFDNFLKKLFGVDLFPYAEIVPIFMNVNLVWW